MKNLNFFYNTIFSFEFLKNISESRFCISNIFLRNIIILTNFSSFLKFRSLSDLFGIDYRQYLQVNYYLLSVDFLSRLLLKSKLVNSITASIDYLFLGANWFEREVWDMYGIFFINHFDLRRILTDYSFQGFPLRKNFPLHGYIEIRYNFLTKNIIYISDNLLVT